MEHAEPRLICHLYCLPPSPPDYMSGCWKNQCWLCGPSVHPHLSWFCWMPGSAPTLSSPLCALKFAKYFCLHYLSQVPYNPLKLGDAYYPFSISTQEWRPKKANILRTICDKVRILRLTLNPEVFLVQESTPSSITL